MSDSLSGIFEVTVVANDIGGIGGMERQLTELITGLLDRGVRVTVISWSCRLPPHPNMRRIRVWGPSRPFAIAYPLFLLFGSILVKLRGRGIIHSTGAILLTKTDVCTVHFCHRAFAALPGFSRASRGDLAHRLNARVSKAFSRAAERWAYRPSRARLLVGVSSGVARELDEHFPRMHGRIGMIPNGVDTRAFHPPEHRPTDEAPMRALFVGSEWERKGLPIAIEALRGLGRTRLTVVGTGDVEAHRRMAAEHGVAERVEFAGPSNAVADWFRRADAFLLPTAYETFSLVTYEAAASGLALLVTRVNGVEDLLRDGENGWFIERDAEQIRDRLERLEREPDRRAEMGAAARRDSLDHDWQRVVDRYVDVYRAAATSA